MMICSRTNLAAVLHDDRDAANYSESLEHIEHCEVCRRKLDSHFAGDAACAEIRSALIESAAGDLNDYAPIDREHASDVIEQTSEIDIVTGLGIKLEAGAHPELLGRIGRYDVERVVGVGGMGVVLKAYDGELHRVVALKLLARHLTHGVAARQRFAREARAAAAVHHPNVLPIYNVEASGDQPYLVMQYIPGESLQSRVERGGALPIAEALRIAKQTAAALAAAHQQGLIHRDVKPANILLEENTDRAVLSDFGLARTADDAGLTRTGIVAGTPQYMSPEQANGDAIDDRSDQFSLGSVLYFMLAGRPPFSGPSAVTVLHRICKFSHEPLHRLNPEVPREISRLVDRLLAKQAAQRLASAAAVVQRIDALLSNLQNGNLRLPSTPLWRSRIVAASRFALARRKLSVLLSSVVAVALITAAMLLDPLDLIGTWPVAESAVTPAGSAAVQSTAAPEPTTEQPDLSRRELIALGSETSFAAILDALPAELREANPHAAVIDDLDRVSELLMAAESPQTRFGPSLFWIDSVLRSAGQATAEQNAAKAEVSNSPSSPQRTNPED